MKTMIGRRVVELAEQAVPGKTGSSWRKRKFLTELDDRGLKDKENAGIRQQEYARIIECMKMIKIINGYMVRVIQLRKR